MKPKQITIAPSTQAGDRAQNDNSCSHSSGNGRFQHSGKTAPCPICGRTKDSDCRWNSEVVLCHTHVDRDAGVPGYVYRGAKEIWGQYFTAVNRVQKPVRAEATQAFIYTDSAGNPLVKVTRIDDGKGKKRIFQSHWDGQQWINKLTPEVKQQIRLYRIADPINQTAIAQGNPLLIVEGEGKVELLLGMGIAATTAIGGAGKWKGYGYPNYLPDLAGANIVLCPDRDQPGLAHCLEIAKDFPDARWLYAFPASPEWNRLPKTGGLDIADWVQAERLTAEQIVAAIAPQRDLTAKLPAKPEVEKPGKPTIAERLLEIAEHCRFFHTPTRKPYADVEIDGVRHTFPVRHNTFKQWLCREFFLQHGKAVNSEALNQVLGVLEGKALFEGLEQEAYLRIAECADKIYLDLGSKDWTAVEISAEGWQVVSDYPVRFRRPETLLPLPCPERGGSIAELRELLNLGNEAWVLVINWLLFSFYPKYPHPILILHGEQGSGKSYTARLLKALIDPGKAPLIPNVADLRNLAIAAGNRWILAYDNLSGLSAEQSDALCRISTGGGFTTRTLYANDEETVLEFIRPQILTGIDSLATRGDLLERSLLVTLPTIREEHRLTEAELEERLTRLQGRILGALLTALSQTLKQLPQTNPDRLPRMADFAKFAIAAETALDLPVGSFFQVYLGNRQAAQETALESSPIATAIQRLMVSRTSWQGTVTELLAELSQLVDETTVKSKAWAGNARSLGKALSRLAPDLRGIGIEVTQERRSSTRLIQLDRIPAQTSQTSSMSQPNHAGALNSDISAQPVVTEWRGNVTSDKSEGHHWQTSPPAQANVMLKSAFQQGFQQISDNRDKSDIKKGDLSSWVGQQVKKRGKLGWFGLVQSVHGHTAEVLWQGDQYPESIPVDELEAIA